MSDVATKSMIEVRGLSLSASGADGPRPLTFSVDLDLAWGETLCLVGESGSGKSITVRTLAGLLPPGVTASGSVKLRGRELIGASEHELRKVRGSTVALLMQDPFTVLNPLQSIRTHLKESLPAATRRDARAAADRIAALLAEVQITDQAVLDRYPFQLSGGMRQRVALAAALARDPEILIADEPTTALDATTQRAILDLIKRIQRERGMAVILVTHDLQLGFEYSDRVMVMYSGNLLEQGPAEQLRRRTLHPYTEGLLRSVPSSRRRLDVLESIPGTIIPAAETVGRCAFANRCRWWDEQCDAGEPPLTEIVAGHASACIRISDIVDELHSDAPISAAITVDSSVAAAVAPAAADRPVLVVSSLTKVFGRGSAARPAVSDVSLTIQSGQSYGVLGESGSGKTTLARCVLGLESPTEGSITIAGRDATDYAKLSRADRREVRQAVQCVFQDPYTSLNPANSVRTALAEALSKARTRSQLTVEDLLELVRLPRTYASRRPHALSGGERQRVAIARALAVSPDLLVCDEPVASLDVSVQAQILSVLRTAHRELGTSMLFITHDLGVARQVTDDVVVMLHGEIVERGTTAQVLDAPQHEYTRQLVAASDFHQTA